MARLKVLSVITHFAVGGATETVLTNCRLADPERFETAILSGRTAHDEEDLVSSARNMGVQVHILDSLQRAMRPDRDYRAYHDLVRWFHENHWDVVHTNGSKAGILGRLAAAKAGVPAIVHTVFGWGHHDHMSRATRQTIVALERRAARVTDRLITVSHANRAKGLADNIGTPDQYSVIYNAIDVPRFRDVPVTRREMRAKLGIAPDAPVVGTVSRLAPQKAPMDFLTVAELVRKSIPEVKFVFVGGGPMQPEFDAAVRARKLDDTILFLGYRNDVPELLRAFDVFLLTSLWEGLPLVIPQASCAAIPSVATAVDGTPEVVVDNETGFLASPHDCAAMAERVIQLLHDQELRERLGQTALERVYPAFCQHEMARQTEAVYEECYARATGQRALSVK